MPSYDRELLVILPCFNERETLSDVVHRVLTHMPNADVLIVDDASPDGTGALADRLAQEEPRVSVLHREGKLGLGTAYLDGFSIARERGYRWVAEMDADGSHLPEQLAALFAEAKRGAGLVIGARWIEGGSIENWPWFRQVVSRVGTKIARISLKSGLHDLTSGYRVISSEWIDALDTNSISSQGYGFQVESAWMLERLGCPVTEVPIRFVERAGGSSKMSCGIVFEALRSVLHWGWRIRVRSRNLPQLPSAVPHTPEHSNPPAREPRTGGS